MAKIIDPDQLNQNTEIYIVPSAGTVELAVAGNLSDDGVTLQAVYSFLKEEWKDDSNLIRYPFPLIAITEEQFELVNGWNWEGSSTRNLVRDGGWALKTSAGVSEEEYMNVTTLGDFAVASADQSYYLQVDASSATSAAAYPGPVNEAVHIYGDATHGDFDYRDYFKIYLREEKKTYDGYDLPTAQNLTALTYKKYALPLANLLDTKIISSDAEIEGAPGIYSNIEVGYYETPVSRDIGGSSWNFNKVISGDGKSAEQIYEKVQYLLRQQSDIDALSGEKVGTVADELLEFVGDTLRTTQGVFIDDFQAADTNRLEFTEISGSVKTFPYVAAGKIIFNDNLQNDVSSKYWMFFTDANGNDYGDSDALLVENNSDVAISGVVGGATEVQFDFDYDGNTQGGRTAGTDAPVIVVALGLSAAQFFKTESTLTRGTANNISLIAALERNYANPE